MVKEMAKKRVLEKGKCWILFILTNHFEASPHFSGKRLVLNK